MTANPEHARAVFTASPESLDAADANAVIEPLVGSRSTLLLDGDEHLQRRRLLLPAFHGKAIQRYREEIREIAATEIESWRPGERVVVRERMQTVTIEVMLRLVFGVRDERSRRRFREALAGFVDEGGNLGIFFESLRHDLGPRSPWGRFLRRRAALDDLLAAEIQARRAAPDAAERHDVLSVLIAARDADGTPLSDADLRDELLTSLVAGHETTATALAWAVDQLHREPRTLARLRETLRSGDETYLDATVNEVLRIRPPVFDAVRAVKRPFQLDGHLLPVGTGIGVATILIHRDPRIYPDPERFQPERFIGERPGTYNWTPFGGGRRRCSGAALALLELKTVLREIVERVTLELGRGPPERIVMSGVTLIPDDGVAVRIAAVA